MSWIEELNQKTVFKYRNESGDVISGTRAQILESTGAELKGEPDETFTYEGSVYSYAGFEPRKLDLETRYEYDQHGRKAVRITKNGEHSYISKTKLHYMKTGRIEPQYTKAFEEQLKKDEQMAMHQTDQYISKARVTAYNEKDGQKK